MPDYYQVHVLHAPPQPWLWMIGCGHFVAGPEYGATYEALDYAHMFVTVAGRGRLRWKGAERTAGPGSVAIIPAWSGHPCGWSTAGDHWDFYYISWRGEGLLRWAEQLQVIVPACSDPVDTATLRELRDRCTSLLSRTLVCGASAQAGLQRDSFLLFHLALEILARPTASRPGPRFHGDDLTDHLHRYLQRRHPSPDRVEELAKRMRVSAKHLSRVFTARVGVPPKRYFLEFRLNQARHLLRETSLPVGDIATRVGYVDHYHFSKLFRKHVGCSPLQYRKREAAPLR